TFNASGSCSSMSLGTGSGGTALMQFSGNSALTLSISTLLFVNTNGSVLILNTSNATHTINLSGNLINNGSFDMNRDGNSRCVMLFSRNGNQSISGTGTVGDFYQMSLNMGSSSSNVLDITSSAFTVPGNFLVLNNGTFKLSTPNTVSVVPFTTAGSIPASAGLWLNSSTAVVSTSNDINLSGLLRVSSGSLNIGNANNEDLIASGGLLDISGGVMTIAGKYTASGTASSFSMSGGSLILVNVQTNNTTLAPFHLSAAGSSFNMSGGSIVILREGGGGGQNLGFINTGSTSGSVSGGTLQIGDAATPAGQQMNINSTYALPSLLLNSANVTAMITTNPLNVVNDVIINSGTLNDNNLSIALGGNWTNNGGSYVNTGTGTVNFNSGSVTQNIFKSGGESFNNLLFSGAGPKQLASAVSAKGFSIQSGSSVDLGAGNNQLSLSGHFINNGTFNARNGLVLLNGSSSQTIGGSSTSSFFDLSLSNSAGAVLSQSENLLGTLSLNSGTFNTNSQIFTIVSTATATARVAALSGSGDITGNVTVQRFVPGGTTGWALLGTPISSPLSLQDWDDDIFISCSTCPDGSAGGFLSIYTYNEAVSGSIDNPLAYVPLSGITDPIVFGKGYWVYMGNGQFTTNDISLDVTGSLRKNNQSIPLSYNNFGSVADDGWNLIHNPYPSAISWTSLRGLTANLDNAIYVYNADLNSGAGGYASFVNGVSSPAPGAGGIDDNIPMGQGFYVHSTGATVLNASESNKVSANPVFLKSTQLHSSASGPPLLRLQLKDTSFRDEAVIYMQAGSSTSFEANFDSYKLPGTDPTAPYLALKNASRLFQIKAVPPVNGTYTTEVLVTCGNSGTYHLELADYASFPFGACIKLFDRYTNQWIDLKSGAYNVNLYDTTLQARFVLSITLGSLSAVSSYSNPDCAAPSGGLIRVLPNSQGPWNFEWRNQNGIIVQTHNNQAFADSLKQLAGGTYSVQASTQGLCDNYAAVFAIQPVVLPLAQFLAPDSLDLTMGANAQFTNTSGNYVSCTWDFGDGSPVFSGTQAQHQYTSPGDFTVRLYCLSLSGCVDSSQLSLNVHATPDKVWEWELGRGIQLRQSQSREFGLYTLGDSPVRSKLQVCDITGRLVLDLGEHDLNHNGYLFCLPEQTNGLYLLRCLTEGKEVVFKLQVQ
ncbi:MAG TPA: PKD domain-containing protein, partial [Bacteroidia bacterium]|nr:PKD domain-containing protein [Bacteroidia bacterium]